MAKCNSSKQTYIMNTLLTSCFLLMGFLGVMLLIHVIDNIQLQRSLCTNLKLRLLLLIVLPTIGCLLATLRKRRSSENAFVNALIPYGIFLPQFLHMVVPVYGLFFITSIIASAIGAGLCVKKNVHRSYSLHDSLRLFLAILSAQQLLCYIVAFLFTAICQSTAFCISLCSFMLIGSSAWIIGTLIYTLCSKHSDKVSLIYQRQKQSNAIRLIGDELNAKPWHQRNIDEKKHIVCQIAEIESDYLGIEIIPNIEYTVLEEDKRMLFPTRKNVAAYRADIDQILLDPSLLMKENPFSILKCLFHELQHAYQARLTNVLPFIPPEYSDLLSIRQIEQIACEFEHYEADINTDIYQQQLCEQDAEAYAHEALYEYRLLWKL